MNVTKLLWCSYLLKTLICLKNVWKHHKQRVLTAFLMNPAIIRSPINHIFYKFNVLHTQKSNLWSENLDHFVVAKCTQSPHVNIFKLRNEHTISAACDRILSLVIKYLFPKFLTFLYCFLCEFHANQSLKSAPTITNLSLLIQRVNGKYTSGNMYAKNYPKITLTDSSH